MKKIFIVLVVFVFIFLLIKIFQQDIFEDTRNEEIVSCSEFYNLKNTEVNLGVNFNLYKPGDVIRINGSIKNNNLYPILNSTLMARLTKDVPNSPYKDEIILDEFNILQNITINSNEDLKINHSYVLPYNFSSGQYHLSFYVIENDRFYFSGQTAFNSVFSSRVNFDILGSNIDYLYIDQSKTYIKDSKIYIILDNPEQLDKNMTITYELYSGEYKGSSKKINETKQDINVLAKSEYVLEYDIKENEYSNYVLSVTAEPKEKQKDESIFREKTLTNVFISLKDQPQIDFLGIYKYPLIKNQENILITCIKNIPPNLGDLKIETILCDENKKEISKIEYSGKIKDDMEGLKKNFIPKNDLSNFSIVTNIYDDEANLIDSFQKEYNCNNIKQDFCVAQEKSKFIFYIMSFIIIFITTIFLLIKIKKNKIYE